MTSLLPYRHRQGHLPVSDISLELPLSERFHKPGCVVTRTGRAAIALLMEHLNLSRDDEVYIVTTFDYPNVSSCVTSTVFNYCKPSRVWSDKTRAIFIIHEFGVPYPDLMVLRTLADTRHIPLIEDCAHTLDSWQGDTLLGTVGDYTICSFPKIFPVPYGGALLGPPVFCTPTSVDATYVDSTRANVAPHIPLVRDYSARRRDVFRELTRRFAELGLKPLFEITSAISPWFFPVPTDDWQECLELASDMEVEIGLWHGTNIVVFPCHQFLDEHDFDRIAQLMRAAQTYGRR